VRRHPRRRHEACKQNLPDTPLGDQYVWSQKVWTLEYIIGAAAHTSFKTREYTHCFVKGPNGCLTKASIGIDPDPPGWTTFAVDVNGVDIPPPQYFWEMLLDVAQESLHDFYDINGTKNRRRRPGDRGGRPEPDLHAATSCRSA
jgi:hypothetical protein